METKFISGIIKNFVDIFTSLIFWNFDEPFFAVSNNKINNLKINLTDLSFHLNSNHEIIM